MKKLLILFLLVVGYNSYSQTPPLVQKFKEHGPIMMWFKPVSTEHYDAKYEQPVILTKDLRGEYLIKAGKYKNYGLATIGVTGLINVIILNSSPMTSTTAKAITGVSLVGGVVALGFEVQSNMMLIKAGQN